MKLEDNSIDLRQGEKVVFETNLHWSMIVISLLYSWIILFIPTLIAFLRFVTTKFIVTNKRVIIKYGILSHNTEEAPLDRVNNINLQQSFLGRIFGYGTVIVQTAAEFGQTTFSYVSDPKKLKKSIFDQMETYKKEQVYEQAEIIAKGLGRNN
ncbi:MAG: PH domain-containing protein [Endomicrobiaceae bacterium]|nr:PH domain-containing protein [Endomicrobiaceae bacterium]